MVTTINKQKLKGNSLLLLTALVWGISFISQSKGVETLSPLAFNGIRSLLGGIVLIPVIFFLDFPKKRKGEAVFKLNRKLLIGGVVCGVFLCIASTVQTAGMVYTSPGKAGFITALYMVIIPIIQLIRGRKPSAAVLLSVVIAVAGLYLMCIDSAMDINKGDIMVLICAFVFAGHILAIDYFSPSVDGVKLACLQFFVCGAIDVVLMLIFEGVNPADVWQSRYALGYSGIMSCGVAYTLQIVGQKYTDPTSASILMSLESVFAALAAMVLTLCGWELTGGMMSSREIFGCVLMFAAIILVQLPEKNKDK